MTLRARSLLPLLPLLALALGAGPCVPPPTVVSEEISIPGHLEPHTPGSGQPQEMAPTANVTALFGPAPNLNRVSYLRTRLQDANSEPVAILILVPGFLGSNRSFAPLAEQLVLQMNGLVEVWSIDRRPNQFEDRLGASHATSGAAQGDLAALAEGTEFYFPDTDNAPLVGIGGAAGPEDGDVNLNGVIDGPFLLQDEFGASRSWVKMAQDDMRFAAYWGIDVPSLGAAAMVQGVAAFYDPTSPAISQRTPVFGGPPISLIYQAPFSNRAIIGAFIDDEFSSVSAFRASVGFTDNGTNLWVATPDGDGFYIAAPGGPLRQWKNIDDPTLPACPPNTFNVSPGCALIDNGPAASTPPAAWGVEQEVTDIDELARIQFEKGNFAEWYYLTGRVSLDQQFGRDSSSLGDESLLAVTQNANMDRPVLAIGGTNGLTPLASSWNSYFGSIATPAADKEIALVEGYAHLDLLTATENATVPIVKDWVVKLLGRKINP